MFFIIWDFRIWDPWRWYLGPERLCGCGRPQMLQLARKGTRGVRSIKVQRRVLIGWARRLRTAAKEGNALPRKMSREVSLGISLVGCYGLLKLKFWQCRSALFSCRLSGTKQGHVVAYPSASHSRFLLLRSFAVLYVLYCACLGLLTIVGLEREKGSFFFYEYNVGHTKQPIILILC